VAYDPHGLGRGSITFSMEETFRPFVASGQLVPLLLDYCPPLPASSYISRTGETWRRSGAS
jgi:hypothetical protein